MGRDPDSIVFRWFRELPMTDCPRCAELLEQQNKLIAEQNELLRQNTGAVQGAADHQYMEALRARVRRNTPWGCLPPTWAR